MRYLPSTRVPSGRSFDVRGRGPERLVDPGDAVASGLFSGEACSSVAGDSLGIALRVKFV
jgi:hypothetical protein